MTSERVAAEVCVSLGAAQQVFETYESRQSMLGDLPVTRILPVRGRRLVGPWCFLDRFGPLSFTGKRPMDVAPHPHIGLQTVSWLLGGEMQHDDSLGSEALLHPGGINVMTAGHGISHAEQTPGHNSGRLDGVQLWIALPFAHRDTQAAFEYVADVPQCELPGGVVRVFAGALRDIASGTTHFSPLVGADIEVHAGESIEVPVDTVFEHAVFLLQGNCRLEGEDLRPDVLHYLGQARSSIELESRAGARVLLLGGATFPEPILMWWNFVAHSHDDIVQARRDWQAHHRFGDVKAYRGQRMYAPDLRQPAGANPIS